jgi:CRISPR/Cas system CMR-associated protein Cmr1 (group 7 of RAMP superfamily)
VPGAKTWMGMGSLEVKKLKPSTMIEVKDISCGNNHRSKEYSPKIGRIPLELARLKYSIDI